MRDDGAIVRAGNFIVDVVGAIRLDAIKSIAENVCFGTAMGQHGDQGKKETVRELTDSLYRAG